ncbi:MAG: cytidine deaminase [Aeromicrobium sp.]
MPLSPEDAKLITLARSSRARIDSREGAAVRDLDGRTYVAATVKLESVKIDALPLAVAMAVSSGAKGLEAGAIVTVNPKNAIVDLSCVRDVSGNGIPVHVADYAGEVEVVQES